jgi:hypothetical protein
MAPYRAQDIPRTVWMFWAQGEADLPPVVATCLARWRLLNPGWDVRVLDRATADGLVDMRDVPKSFPLRIYADSLRLRLLERFGGVWADATVYPHRPLADWLGFLAASGFFLFTDDGPGREVSSWFIAARPGHPLATAWNRAFSRHLSRTDGPHEAYFHLYYVMQYALKHDFALKAHWAVMPRVPAPPCFFLRSCLEGLTPASAARDAIRSGLPISKMDWRLPETGENLDTRIARILALD